MKTKADKKGKAGRKGIALAILSLLLLNACATTSPSGITLPGNYAVKANFSEERVQAIAARVKDSLNLPQQETAVPKVTFTKYLPGDCNRRGCPVGMYRSGRIFILEDLDVSLHSMVLAHELIHHYSKVHGLGLSENQVIAATTKAGYRMPTRVARR